jgi:hypothetical protein
VIPVTGKCDIGHRNTVALARNLASRKMRTSSASRGAALPTAAHKTWNGGGTMLIREMNPRECRDLLMRLGSGRLGVARNNQPYVIPIYFAY